jgi:hypothetical protein
MADTAKTADTDNTNTKTTHGENHGGREDITEKNKHSHKKKMPRRPMVQLVSITLLSVIVGAGAAMLFVLISGSGVAFPIAAVCAILLCLLSAAALKLYTVVRRLKSRELLCALCILGLLLSAPITLSYYVSHDYELSVYRYMRQTKADKYYFAGYESYLEDYADASDFMRQMKAAPASIVLENMSEEKISGLSASELKTINNESLWDYCGFDDILGDTPEQVEDSVKTASDMSAYDFTFDYRNLRAKTFGYLLSHPKLAAAELISLIKRGSDYSVSFVWLAIFGLAQMFCCVLAQLSIEVRDGQVSYVPYRRQSGQKKQDSSSSQKI